MTPPRGPVSEDHNEVSHFVTEGHEDLACLARSVKSMSLDSSFLSKDERLGTLLAEKQHVGVRTGVAVAAGGSCLGGKMATIQEPGDSQQPVLGPDASSMTPTESMLHRPSAAGGHRDMAAPGLMGGAARVDVSAPAEIPWTVRGIKRSLDIVAALVGLTLGAPIFLLVALWVYIDNPGPVFYRQKRERFDAKGQAVPFFMLKFRSMRVDAERDTGPVWAQQADTRVTRCGAVLRKYRIDELPQLFNVLIGQMSLVGPRPERPFFTQDLETKIPAYNDRLKQLKPGVTGWAQVSLDYDSTLDSVKTKTMYDLTYLAHHYKVSSYLKMETRVILRTVGVMRSGKGAR